MSASTSAIFKSPNPCCIAPKNCPGPRSRKSSSARRKPSLVSSITRSRSAPAACRPAMRMQYDASLPRPTRPRS